MANTNIVKDLLKKGYLIDPSLTKLLADEALEQIPVVDLLLGLGPPKFINTDFFVANLPKIVLEIRKKGLGPEETTRAMSYLAKFVRASEIDARAEEQDERRQHEHFLNKAGKVLVFEVKEPKIKKIGVEDFVACFRDRFLTLKSFIHEHKLDGLTSIGKITNVRRVLSVVGMVSNIRITKNKNLLIEVEDLTGKISVVVNHEKTEVFEKAKNVVLDEVIGIQGVGSREILFANDIVFPDIAAKEKKKANVEEYAIFTADLHVGSDKFLEENFVKFIDWLNGKIGSEKQRELASKVKYFFIVGDTVDGVGVYPKQEKELKIKDIREQYQKLAAHLASI
ncbi:MAG: hypothetical protein K6T16_01275 [Candidatus Pacearchaeota archaeon]|nr:hypothetical protein [Candidatus Pacearchaeota archaeon]